MIKSSSASVRSFQSDLERINESFDRQYRYAGQTSASAMRQGAPRSVTRKPESVISSAMSDTSDIDYQGLGPRRKGRVSFSDVDETETRSRGPSPSPAQKRVSLRPGDMSPAKAQGQFPAQYQTQNSGHQKKSSYNESPMNPSTAARELAGRSVIGRGNSGGIPNGYGPTQNFGMAPPLVRRASNSSVHSVQSNTSFNHSQAPLSQVQQQNLSTSKLGMNQGNGSQESLSTIESHGSVYSDAEEDFKASPPLKKDGTPATSIDSGVGRGVPLTRQNLAAVVQAPVPQNQQVGVVNMPIKSAMKSGSVNNGYTGRHLQHEAAEFSDSDSDNSMRRRRNERAAGRRMQTSLRGGPTQQAQQARPSERMRSQSLSGMPTSTYAPRPVGTYQQQQPVRSGPQRMNSNTSVGSRVSRATAPGPDPVYMRTSLRGPPVQRQSTSSRRTQSVQYLPMMQPALARRESFSSLRNGSNKPVARRGSVSTPPSTAALQHISVMDTAKKNVAIILGRDPNATEAPIITPKERHSLQRKGSTSSFERKKSPPGLQRHNSKTSMQERNFRTSLRPQADAPRQESFVTESPQPRFFSQSMRNLHDRSNSVDYAQSEPATPLRRKGLRRFSFGNRGKSNIPGDIPRVPALPKLRRTSTDSDRPVRTKAPYSPKSALRTGTLRGNPEPLAQMRQNDVKPSRPASTRAKSEISISHKTGKPKKFQKLRKFFGIKD